MPKRFWAYALFLVWQIFASFSISQAYAFSMDKSSSLREQCEISLGPDPISIVTYMPDQSRDRFCDEFPFPGKILLTFDLISTRLRDLPIDIRLVHEPNGSLENETDLGQHTVSFIEQKIYPNGAIVIANNFSESGNYAAFLTVHEPFGVTRTTRFGFRIGGKLLYYTPAILAAIFLFGLVYAYCFGRKRV
ncbi:MAG: hypothetical protein ACKOEW_02590 [Methylocystis sp.]